MPDDELRARVQRAREGDPAAFGELFDRFERSIYGLCYHLTNDADAAADAAQQAFVNAFRRIGQLQHPEAFASWLRSAAVNACRHRRRQRRRQQTWTDAFGADGPDAGAELADQRATPAEQVARDELSAEVRAALQALSPEHREVIVLHHLQEVPLADIAATLGVAVGTVKSRLGRGRRRLAELLRAYVEPDAEPETEPEAAP